MINRVFNSQTKSISGAAAILAVSTILSGILGLIRDRLLAATFGAGIETSIYFAAFRVPDLVYNILILGGILVAFLPLFSEYFSQNPEEAWQMTNYVLNAFLILLVLVCFILFLLAPLLVNLITPGFGQNDKATVVTLTRILFLSPIFFGLANIFSGILHYFNCFLAYSIAPILYNIGIILGIIFLTPYFNIFGVGLGVVFGAFLYLLIQIPSVIHQGLRYKFLVDFKYPAFKRIFFLMIPRTCGIIANQVNLIVITAIASTITIGSIAIFNFSNNLQGIATSVFGISLATAVFPTFSKLLANGQKKEFTERFSSLLRQTLFLIVPVSILMFLLRAQIVRLILGTGRFDWEDTRLTAASLGLFSLSIFASTLIPFITRAFFSLKDTKTPALVTIISVIVNIILSCFFVWLLTFSNFFSKFLVFIFDVQNMDNIYMLGLPLAFSIAAILQFVLLLYFLRKRIKDFGLKEVLGSLKKIFLAGFFMASCVYLTLQLAGIFVNMQTFLGVFLQAAIASFVGFCVYILATKALGSPEVQNIKYLIFRQLSGLY
jgi:putative peptidoglycan lipid II flippase